MTINDYFAHADVNGPSPWGIILVKCFYEDIFTLVWTQTGAGLLLSDPYWARVPAEARDKLTWDGGWLELPELLTVKQQLPEIFGEAA